MTRFSALDPLAFIARWGVEGLAVQDGGDRYGDEPEEVSILCGY